MRDIRNRITSIKNTQQITKAMKMVAAAKLRKAQQRMTETRPFAQKLQSVAGRLVTGGAESGNALLRQPETIQKVAMIVVGSDRGLCGGFNTNLFRTVETHISAELSEFQDSDKLDLFVIGRKGDQYFRKRKYQVVKSWPGFFDTLNYEDTSAIMSDLSLAFAEGKYDRVLIAFNEFKTVIAQNRVITDVLPVQVSELETDIEPNENALAEYLYEPDAPTILSELLPLYLNMQLWRAVLESNASEQGARMAAMDNATENAKELEQELSLKYNQARQSAITTEISEIVSGAAALGG
ncbi:MAG: ATP synthase F1 subunit gamma [Balneolaceae bacterium]|nr:MAG: ATP synthase F1 subunit gamma [Balneolaceae bacterium]